MKTSGYSIWLVPERENFTKFVSLINIISEDIKSPKFDPHITLLGDIHDLEVDVLKKCEEIANRISNFEINLGEVDYEDFYLKAIFIRAEKGAKLVNANTTARKFFDKDLSLDYMPHLSLMYADIPKSRKMELIEKYIDSYPKKIEIKKISLYKVFGGVKDWKLLKEFQLKY